ncbi:exotoxin A binding domain-containing protein [Pseudomonas aeruginosa]|nr:exotoxin A binding domain-containing protein [Pseudomonas aeruginosa]
MPGSAWSGPAQPRREKRWSEWASGKVLCLLDRWTGSTTTSPSSAAPRRYLGRQDLPGARRQPGEA